MTKVAFHDETNFVRCVLGLHDYVISILKQDAWMQKYISGTMFYSLLFAMGGAPTIALLIIKAQTNDPVVVNNALLGLSVIIACILIPLVLIQNAFLFFKRNDVQLEAKIKPLCQLYFGLNVACLIFWLCIQFL